MTGMTTWVCIVTRVTSMGSHVFGILGVRKFC